MMRSETLATWPGGMGYEDFKDHTPIGMPIQVVRPAGHRGYPGHMATAYSRLTVVGWFHVNDLDVIHRMPREAMVGTASETAPGVLLKVRNGGGIRQDRSVVIVPAADHCNHMMMASGCFAATDDSRMTALVRDLLGYDFYGAIPIHDWEK